MADGGRSYLQASDVIYDFSCSLCSENKRNSEAIYRCVECKHFLCANCRDGHNHHNVVDVRANDIGESSIHLKGYTCEEHADKLIEMYCKTHDGVYCPVCILQHRSCKGVEYIPNVAKTLLKNQDKVGVESQLKQQIVDLQKLKDDRLKYLSILAEDKDDNIKTIKSFKGDLIKKAEELEKSLLLEIEKKYIAITDDVNLDREKIDQLINDVEKYLSKIVAGKYDDVKDEVVTFRLSENQVIAANKQILDLALKKEEMVDFQCSPTFEEWLEENRFGNLNISRKSRNTVHIYNADEEYADAVKKRIECLQPLLTDVGIHSKVTDDLQDGNAGDLYVGVVSEIPDLEKLVNDLNKGNVKNSRRYKVLVVCLAVPYVTSLFHGSALTHTASKKLCTEYDLPYICVEYKDSDFSDAVKLIKKTVDE